MMKIKQILASNKTLKKSYRSLRDWLFEANPQKFKYSKYGIYLTGNKKDYSYRASIDTDDGFQVPKVISILPHNAIFIDIGTNIGSFSILAAKHLKQGHVYSFEPNYLIFRYLIDNIEHNNVENITPICAAISKNSIKLEAFYSDPSHSGKASLDKKNMKPMNVVTIDYNIFNELEIKSDQLVCIKIDVEGHEKHVIESLFKSNIMNQVQYLVIEMLEKHKDQNLEIIQFLKKRSYILDQSFNADPRHLDKVFIKSP